MAYLWLIIWLICVVDSGFIMQYKIVWGRLERDRATVEMTWHKILEIFVLLGVFLLITSNRTGVDIINYRNWYIREEMVKREPLYTFMRIAFHRAGVSFYVFRAILTFILGILPVLAYRRNKIPITFFMVFYMPSILFIDSMQFRNAIALCMVIWGTDYLVSDIGLLKNRIVFSISILFAAQLHTSFYAFFIFLLMTSKHKKTYGKLIFLCSLFLLMVSMLNGRKVPFVDVLYSLVLKQGDSRIYGFSGGNKIFLYPMVVHLFIMIILNVYTRYFDKEKAGIYAKDKVYLDFINTMNMAFFAVVPLIMMNTTFYRYLRNLYPFQIVSGFYLCRNFGKSKKSLAVGASLMVVSLLWLVFMVGVYSRKEIILDPILVDGVFFWK